MVIYQTSGRPSGLISLVADWLMEQALKDVDLETIVMGCCERLYAAGIPIYRGYFAFTVLHPLHAAMGFTWTRGKGVSISGYPHVPGGVSAAYLRSPQYYLIERGLEYLRRRIDSGPAEFPILDDLREEGATDYLAFVVGFTPGTRDGMLGSWATDREDGFTDGEIEALLRIQGRLAVACKMAVRAQLARNVAATYLGRDAGNRVLNGQIRRGDGDAIRAAIWYSDMRESTHLASTLPRQDYIETLNAYFGAAGAAVRGNGGEILSFIGDAVLAIFPCDDTVESQQQSCRGAVAATRDAVRRIAAVNAERRPGNREAIDFGIGLHIGEVMFGNVGAIDRLAFSVFGSAVNEVVRLERLTKDLREPVLASARFVRTLGDDWRPLGEFPLRGTTEPMAIYAPSGL